MSLTTTDSTAILPDRAHASQGGASDGGSAPPSTRSPNGYGRSDSDFPRTRWVVVMSTAMDMVLRYGYVALFAYVLVSQLGTLLPSAPLMLAAGALVATKRLALAPTMNLPGLGLMVPPVV